MKYLALIFLSLVAATGSKAQRDTYDLVSFTAPGKWTKDIKANLVNFTTINDTSKTWCIINIIKSTKSKGSIEADFESEWQELVVQNYKPTGAPETSEVREANGWKIKAGGAKFSFNNNDAMAMLTTMSGFDRCVSIVAVTNSDTYLKDIAALLASIDVTKPETKTDQTPPPKPLSNNYTFTTTNFDDGWTSTVQEDWVQVIKGNIRVLVHYPNKEADAYNSVITDGLKNAWNILVAPKYSTAANFEFKSISGWQIMVYAEADAVEKLSGKKVHVVLFKRHYSNGSGKYIEVITPDKNAFEREFGPYNESAASWDKLEQMVTYNKFAVGAADLSGKWTNKYSGAIQYVNAYTGADAGMNSHSSAENFQFGPGNVYHWDLVVASGVVGNIKFQSAKSSGKFSMVGNWQVRLSDIEGRPRIYNAHFSCIKGFRILWLDDSAYFKVE